MEFGRVAEIDITIKENYPPPLFIIIHPLNQKFKGGLWRGNSGGYLPSVFGKCIVLYLWVPLEKKSLKKKIVCGGCEINRRKVSGVQHIFKICVYIFILNKKKMCLYQPIFVILGKVSIKEKLYFSVDMSTKLSAPPSPF